MRPKREQAPTSMTSRLRGDFVRRHIGPRDHDIARMLRVVGASSLDALIDEAIPADIRQQHPLEIGSALSETELSTR